MTFAHRRPSLVLAFASIVLALGACEDKPAAPTPKPPPSPTASTAAFTVGYSQCNRGEPWREQMDKDIEANAKKHPEIKLIMKDAQNDALAQQAHVKEFIAQAVDVLIISPKDTSLTQVVADAYKAGVPVIVLDRKVEGD